MANDDDYPAWPDLEAFVGVDHGFAMNFQPKGIADNCPTADVVVWVAGCSIDTHTVKVANKCLVAPRVSACTDTVFLAAVVVGSAGADLSACTHTDSAGERHSQFSDKTSSKMVVARSR